jgi:hypothetical protein
LDEAGKELREGGRLSEIVDVPEMQIQLKDNCDEESLGDEPPVRARSHIGGAQAYLRGVENAADEQYILKDYCA